MGSIDHGSRSWGAIWVAGSETVEQGVCTCFLNLGRGFSDPEAFQKLLILFRSTIQMANFLSSRGCLTRLVEVLSHTESFDCYGWFRLPREFFYPYCAESIDEQVWLDALIHAGVGQKEEVRETLASFLQWMAEEGHDYLSAEGVRQVCLQWLKRQEISVSGWEEVPVPLKSVSTLERVADLVLAAVDIACLPAFLRDWSFLDLSHYAARIGRLPLLSWVPGQSLDDFVWGLMGLGHALRFFIACQNYCQEGIGVAERRHSQREMVASATYALYCATMIQKRAPQVRPFFAFFAASCGLFAFFLAPKPTFFSADAKPAFSASA